MVIAQTAGWKLLALRGAVAALFGVFALVRPATTATAVVVLIGAFVLVDGVLGTIGAFRTSGRQGQTTLGIAEGVLGLVVGLIAVIAPDAALRFLSVLIGLWALLTGALEIAAAIGSRPVDMSGAGSVDARGRVNWLLGTAGALSLILGGILVFSPGAGVVLITVLIGVYALGFGIALIALALRIRRAPTVAR